MDAAAVDMTDSVNQMAAFGMLPAAKVGPSSSPISGAVFDTVPAAAALEEAAATTAGNDNETTAVQVASTKRKRGCDDDGGPVVEGVPVRVSLIQPSATTNPSSVEYLEFELTSGAERVVQEAMQSPKARVLDVVSYIQTRYTRDVLKALMLGEYLRSVADPDYTPRTWSDLIDDYAPYVLIHDDTRPVLDEFQAQLTEHVKLYCGTLPTRPATSNTAPSYMLILHAPPSTTTPQQRSDSSSDSSSDTAPVLTDTTAPLVRQDTIVG